MIGQFAVIHQSVHRQVGRGVVDCDRVGHVLTPDDELLTFSLDGAVRACPL